MASATRWPVLAPFVPPCLADADTLQADINAPEGPLPAARWMSWSARIVSYGVKVASWLPGLTINFSSLPELDFEVDAPGAPRPQIFSFPNLMLALRSSFTLAWK